jgi:hypothetical protein
MIAVRHTAVPTLAPRHITRTGRAATGRCMACRVDQGAAHSTGARRGQCSRYLVVQVDVVSAEPRQRLLQLSSNRLGLRATAAHLDVRNDGARCRRNDAKLCGDDELVAACRRTHHPCRHSIMSNAVCERLPHGRDRRRCHSNDGRTPHTRLHSSTHSQHASTHRTVSPTVTRDTDGPWIRMALPSRLSLVTLGLPSTPFDW